jgi:hypothetical protein
VPPRVSWSFTTEGHRIGPTGSRSQRRQHRRPQAAPSVEFTEGFRRTAAIVAGIDA